MKKLWQFWIDRGGSFTDVIGKRPDGALVTHKLPSGHREQYRDAAVAGMRHLFGLGASDPLRDVSGDQRRWTGGNGGVRRIWFLEAMTASILSNGRKHGAFDMAGGEPGQVGRSGVVRASGQTEELAHIGQAEMAPGDIFETHTPGCGGFGHVYDERGR